MFPRDTEANFPVKRSPSLEALVAQFHLTDAFLALHHRQSFTFQRHGSASSRLDRAYLTPVFTHQLLEVSHLPSLSDHAALVVVLAGDLHRAPPPPRPSSYWKLNTSLLSNEDFLPSFTIMWQSLLDRRPRGACPADWWEDFAKPACRDFCIAYSKTAAHRRRELAAFLHSGLRAALRDADWRQVAVLRGRLAEHARYRLTGKAVRSRLDQAAGADLDLDLLEATDVGTATDLLRISARGGVLTDPQEIETEILDYFGALFQGRHVATADRPEPFDSGQPFTHLHFCQNFCRICLP